MKYNFNRHGITSQNKQALQKKKEKKRGKNQSACKETEATSRTPHYAQEIKIQEWNWNLIGGFMPSLFYFKKLKLKLK